MSADARRPDDPQDGDRESPPSGPGGEAASGGAPDGPSGGAVRKSAPRRRSQAAAPKDGEAAPKRGTTKKPAAKPSGDETPP